MTDERKAVLSNGITLYPDRRWAPHLECYARRKGFPGMRAFVAVEPGGQESYLLADGREPIYETTSYEDACVHIDILAADRDLPP